MNRKLIANLEIKNQLSPFTKLVLFINVLLLIIKSDLIRGM